MNFLIKPIKFPPAENQIFDWKIEQLFNGPIGCFENFHSHISALKPNILPHPINSHKEEELIIPLLGNLEILTSEYSENKIHDSFSLEPGSFLYHTPGQSHSLQCNGPEASLYLIFKWVRACSQTFRMQGTFTCDRHTLEGEFVEISTGFHLLNIEGLTDHTNGSLQAHFSRLETGAGYKMHRDNYDIIAVLLEGELETFNLSVKAPAFLFFAAGTPHRFQNPGTRTATYIVFEFTTIC